MTVESEEPRTESKVVVFFDMCSSSTIMEDLKATDNLGAMRNLLIKIKKFLVDNQQLVGYKVYKFVGDGWILLFPDDVNGATLIKFLEALSALFRKEFGPVQRRLQKRPSIIGLTFGIDKGVLIRMEMMGQTEYIGRALNVAARLQSAIKDTGDDDPAYKCLLSMHAYSDLHLPGELKDRYQRKHTKRVLRNIQGEQPCRCVKLILPR